MTNKPGSEEKKYSMVSHWNCLHYTEEGIHMEIEMEIFDYWKGPVWRRLREGSGMVTDRATL